MRILIYSPSFYPNIGGLEEVVTILSNEFVDRGHQIKLVTQTPASDSATFPFEVIRLPNPLTLLKLMQWCDIFFQPNISIKGLWPLILCPRPWVVAHHAYYTKNAEGQFSWASHLKHYLVQFATGISVSQAVADFIKAPSVVIHNPYRDHLFKPIPATVRDKDLVFLGRLVSDKGVDLLLQALAELKLMGLMPTLTIVGMGPEEEALRQQAINLDIGSQVDFVGAKFEQELVQILNAHQILVVPSCWQEPFGIVALEGIACGCVVVGSDVGGVKEAIGPCGVTFPQKDYKALTQVLASFLKNPDKLDVYRQSADQHLSHHHKARVAQAYLQVFEEAIQ